MRSLPPQLSFADLELQFQGVQLDPSLRAVSAFLDQHLTLIEQVRKDLERSLKNARTGRNGIAPSQVLRSLVLMRWPKKDIPAHIAFMKRLNKELRESGELVAAEGLSWPDPARLVRAGKDGTPITDGVFPEGKEFLAGYWIVDVETAKRAYAIAARESAAPGVAGAPLNMPIEVRPVMSGRDEFVS